MYAYRLYLPSQISYLIHQLCLFFRGVLEVESGLMRDDDGQVCGYGEHVAQRPCLKEVKGNVDVRVQKRLERDEPLLYFLRAVPVLADFVFALGGPTAQENFHGVDGLADGIVGGVDYVVEEELWDEAEDLGEEDGGRGRRLWWRNRHRRCRGNACRAWGMSQHLTLDRTVTRSRPDRPLHFADSRL